MTPQEFIAKWGKPHGIPGPGYALNEEQGAQSHFLDLCELLDVPKPGSTQGYLFEEKSAVIGGKTGYADVFMRGVFAWENKAPGKNLDNALKQLLTYSLALSNPPILVVSDRLLIRIHTQFTGHPSQTFEVPLEELNQPTQCALLRRIWTAPESFKPSITSRDITEAAAQSFATLAEGLRKRCPAGVDAADYADQVAHFLTQCLFCFFAEDVGLLPGRMFETLVKNRHLTSDKLSKGFNNLFATMQGGGLYGSDDLPVFNGGLFKTIAVPELTIMEVTELRKAAALNWSAIDVSIFGTLFERGLDPAKRSQLGAHYTDPATILRIIEPVLSRPLLQQWELLTQSLKGLMAKSKRQNDKHHKEAQALFVAWLERLKNYRLLDPACGSGNFLFLGLKALKDIEHKSHLEAAALGLDRQAELVTGPHNVLGMEINEYAAELARLTVWIGELQWRMTHGYAFKTDPVLQPLDHIACADALLRFEEGRAVEAIWPKADVVMGNPPFLGQRFQVRELGEPYTKVLRSVYQAHVSGNVDLVCYWFVKAIKAMQGQTLGAAGFVATNSIRGGDNRAVLSHITAPFQIFNAWSDEPWVNEGASVRVSLVCFGKATTPIELNGHVVDSIYPDLSAVVPGHAPCNLTLAVPLAQSQGAAFSGFQMNGQFNISHEVSMSWIQLPNPNGKSSLEVLHPYVNASDITKRPRNEWVIDFTGLTEAQAALFEAPFAHVIQYVKQERASKRESYLLEKYWLHKRSTPQMRTAIKHLSRFIATPMVSKYRLFVWLPTVQLPENAAIVIARADDTTFGILHSRFHELWSLRMCTWMGVGNDPRYTPTTCFETFPFPAGLTPEDTAHQRTEKLPSGALIPEGIANPALCSIASAIAQAAATLTTQRNNWLNPEKYVEWVQTPEEKDAGYPARAVAKPGFADELKKRTLTNLYNEKPAWLLMAHAALDQAVAAAYGWTDYTPSLSDDELLRRLLALNLSPLSSEESQP